MPHADDPLCSASDTAEPTVPVARYISAIDAAEMLWTVVANVSGGDWQQQSPEWQLAAARWRDNYHDELARYRALLQTLPVIDAAFTAPVRSPEDCGAPVAEPPYWARQLAATAWCTPSTSHIVMDPVLADSFAAILAEDARCSLECSALRAQLAACRDALEAARPLCKARAVDGSPSADHALDLIQRALDHSPASLGTSADVPGT